MWRGSVGVPGVDIGGLCCHSYCPGTSVSEVPQTPEHYLLAGNGTKKVNVR